MVFVIWTSFFFFKLIYYHPLHKRSFVIVAKVKEEKYKVILKYIWKESSVGKLVLVMLTKGEMNSCLIYQVF